MNVHRPARLLRSLCAAAVLAVVLTPSSAHAAPNTATGNYQVDVQVTNGPFSYGGSTFPQFQVTLTALNGTTLPSCTGSTFVTISIDTDPGTNWGSNSQSPSGTNTCVYTFTGPSDWSHYPPGSRMVTAQATVSGQVVATGTATFTVNKAVTSISCFVNTPGVNFQTGSTLQIAQDVQGPSSTFTPDWTQSTFNVTFTGPQSVTYSNITPDTTPGTGWLSVQAPTTPGHYTMTCAFNGYGDYAPSTSGSVGVDISAFNQVGGIALYTNPTTYNPNQSCDVYIVIRAAPGGPTPTGRASITIGQNYSPVMNLSANGTLSLRLGPLASPSGSQIRVDYQGDSYYRWTSSTFSFTNPAIPSNAPTSGGSTGSPQATTTATENSSGTPTTASGSGAQDTGATPAPVAGAVGSSGNSGFPWPLVLALGLLALLLAGGGTVVAVMLVRRSRMAPPSAEPWARETTLTPVSPRGWSTDEPTWPARGGNLDDPWR